MWGALRGLAKGLGDNQPVYPSDPGWLPGLMTMPDHGLASVLPPAVWVLAAVALVAVVEWLRADRQDDESSAGAPSTTVASSSS